MRLTVDVQGVYVCVLQFHDKVHGGLSDTSLAGEHEEVLHQRTSEGLCWFLVAVK